MIRRRRNGFPLVPLDRGMDEIRVLRPEDPPELRSELTRGSGIPFDAVHLSAQAPVR